MGRNCALVVHVDVIDEARYDIFETRRDGDGVVVSRCCWWFDEEVQQWLIDESSEWFFTAEQAMQLGMAIHQAALPAAADRQAG